MEKLFNFAVKLSIVTILGAGTLVAAKMKIAAIAKVGRGAMSQSLSYGKFNRMLVDGR